MTVESRLSALERSNHRLRLAVRALGLALVVLLAAGARGNEIADLVQARRIQVVDDEGRPLVVLAHEAGRGVAALLDAAGNWKVQLDAGSAGGTVATKAAHGGELVFLGVDDQGNGTVRTESAAGGLLAALTAAEGRGAVITYDGSGREHVKIATAYGGAGSVTTFSGDGRRLMQITAATDGDGLLAAFRPDGGVRARWP
jgi:hypothetical protein